MQQLNPWLPSATQGDRGAASGTGGAGLAGRPRAAQPAEGLRQARGSAKFVFSNVAVIGVLLTGLGLFTDLGAVLASTPKVWGVPLPVSLLGTSLILAVLALLPLPRRSRDVSSVDSTIKTLKFRNRWVGTSCFLALILFAAAIASAALQTFNYVPPSKDPTISASLTGVGDETTLEATVEASGISAKSDSNTTITGVGPAGQETVLFKSDSHPDASGTLKVEAEVGKVGTYQSFTIDSTVSENNNEVERSTPRSRVRDQWSIEVGALGLGEVGEIWPGPCLGRRPASRRSGCPCRGPAPGGRRPRPRRPGRASFQPGTPSAWFQTSSRRRRCRRSGWRRQSTWSAFCREPDPPAREQAVLGVERIERRDQPAAVGDAAVDDQVEVLGETVGAVDDRGEAADDDVCDLVLGSTP